MPLPDAPEGPVPANGNGTARAGAAQPPDVIHLPAAQGPTWDAPRGGGSLDDDQIPFSPRKE